MRVVEYGVPPPRVDHRPRPWRGDRQRYRGRGRGRYCSTESHVFPLGSRLFSDGHEATRRPSRAHRRHDPYLRARDTYLALTEPQAHRPGRVRPHARDVYASPPHMMSVTAANRPATFTSGRSSAHRRTARKAAVGLSSDVETEPHSLGGGFAAGMGGELAEDRRHVVIDRLVRHHETLGDLGVAHALA